MLTRPVPRAQFSRLGVVLHNPFRFVFVNDLEAAPEPAAAAEGVTAAVPAPVPPAPAPAAVAAPVAAPLAGRRRARENDTSPQPPATRRRTAAAAAAAAAAAQAAAAAATAALAAAAPPMSAGLRSTLERFARFAGGAHPGQQREAAPRPAPPLPTFEPLAVAPFPGDTAAELAAGISAESQCSICYELYVAPHATACSHIFCGECITKALQLRPDSCPECRGKAGAPVYVRKLDALLCAAVEPRLSEQEAQERQRRKRSWQDMQVAKAVAARDAAPARGVASVAYRPLQRGSGLVHGPAAALPDAAAPDGEPDVVAWRVAVVAGGARLVCHACFGALQPGDVRVLREVTAPEPTNGTFARPQLPRSRQFFHPGCCPAGCPPVAELQGVAALTAPERAAATAAMEAAAAARQQPAPAAQAAPGSRRRIGQLRRAGIVVHARWQQ